MQHPMRERLMLDNPAQASIHGANSASLFIPGGWTGRRLALRPAPGVTWSAVQCPKGEGIRQHGDWDLTGVLEPGGWQTVAVAGGPIAGAALESSNPLYIARLEGWYDPPETLSIRVRLGKLPAATGRTGLITLLFVLADERGEQVGRQEVMVGPRTAELAVAMALAREPHGRCRLKASLCVDQQVIDDARIELDAF